MEKGKTKSGKTTIWKLGIKGIEGIEEIGELFIANLQ